MKNTFYLLILLLTVNIASAQSQKSLADSADYYKKELDGVIKAYHDSLLKDPRVKALRENLKRASAATDNYNAFVVYTQLSSVDFKKLNADNATNGFTPLSGAMISIGYGFSFKKDRRMLDFNVGAFGINKKTSIGDEVIKTSFSTFLQFEVGYDFLKSKIVNLYPYAGIGLRTTSLEYDAPAQVNQSPANITDVVLNNNSVGDQRVEASYHAGIGVEVVITRPSMPRGMILFVKGGTNRAFSKKGFDLEGYKYKPDLNIGNGMITAGVKVFGR
jgi:hypothetical protein